MTSPDVLTGTTSRFSTGLVLFCSRKSSSNFLWLILVDAVFLHQWWHLEVATQEDVGEGDVLVS